MLVRLLPLVLVALAIAPAQIPAMQEGEMQPFYYRPGQAVPLSFTGPLGDTGYAAVEPAVAYNADANEYLVVWSGNATGEYEIHGQRVDAGTGHEVGPNDFRISRAGPDGDTSRGAFAPAVAYNPVASQYLVVWMADDNPGYDNDFEIFAQRLSATGDEIGADYALTVTGPSAPITGTCNSSTAVLCPPSLWRSSDVVLVYNANSNEYFLVYLSKAPRLTGPGVVESINALRLGGSGAVIAPIAIISRTWDHETSTFVRPALAHNRIANEFAVVWQQYLFNDLSVPVYRLFTTRYSAAGALLGGGVVADFRPGGFAFHAIAHNDTRNEFVVVWDEGLLTRQLFGRRLSASLATLGDPFGIGGATAPQAPRVEFDAARDEYLVAWTAPAGSGARTVLAQRLSGTADPTGDRIWVGRGNTLGLAYGSRTREYLVAWSGYGLFGSSEFEVIGWRYAPHEPFVVGLGTGGGGKFQVWRPSYARMERESARQLPWPTYNAAGGEVHPALGDLDGDGLHETVIGLARGGQGWIAIFDDASHNNALLAWVQLPWPAYNAANGTIWPAVGDIDGDGKAEVIAGVGTGGGGWYAIFDDAAHGFALLTWRRINWAWYNATQSGETRPAVANVDGGSFSEIVIGLGPGGAGWLELVDDAASGYAHLRWLRIGRSADESYPAAGDVDGDGYDEIVVGLGPGSQGLLQVFDDAFTGLAHKAWLQVDWSDYANTNGETHPAVGDVDGDPGHEIVIGLGVYPGQGGWFEIRDDFSNPYWSTHWRNVGRGDLYASGGATFPAIGRAP